MFIKLLILFWYLGVLFFLGCLEVWLCGWLLSLMSLLFIGIWLCENWLWWVYIFLVESFLFLICVFSWEVIKYKDNGVIVWYIGL